MPTLHITMHTLEKLAQLIATAAQRQEACRREILALITVGQGQSAACQALVTEHAQHTDEIAGALELQAQLTAHPIEYFIHVQCTATGHDHPGTFIAPKGCRTPISPMFRDLAELYRWMRETGWMSSPDGAAWQVHPAPRHIVLTIPSH